MGKTRARLLAMGVILASGVTCLAQDGGDPPVSAVQCCSHPARPGFSLGRLWEWLTYRPLPVPRDCKCRKCAPTCTPPLYTYFMGHYGPRSPIFMMGGGPHPPLEAYGSAPVSPPPHVASKPSPSVPSKTVNSLKISSVPVSPLRPRATPPSRSASASGTVPVRDADPVRITSGLVIQEGDQKSQ